VNPDGSVDPEVDIHPDKVDAYLKWTAGAIKRTVGVPGVVDSERTDP